MTSLQIKKKVNDNAEKLGMTVVDYKRMVGNQANCCLGTVYNFMKGKPSVRGSVVKTLCDSIGISTDDYYKAFAME